MKLIKHLYLYIFLTFVPSSIQATSILDKIDQCLKYVEEYRQSKAIFRDYISRDIERKIIILYLTCIDRSSMRRVSVSCYDMIESFDHGRLLKQVENGNLVFFHDERIQKLRKGSLHETISFLTLDNRKNYNVLAKEFPISLFKHLERQCNSSYKEPWIQEEDFLLAFFKTKGLSKKKFPKLSSKMVLALRHHSLDKNISLVLKCLISYPDIDVVKHINDILATLPKEQISFEQIKQYLAICYQSKLLTLFGKKLNGNNYYFQRFAKRLLENKEEGEELLGEVCYAAFHHNSKQEPVKNYSNIRKYVHDLCLNHELLGDFFEDIQKMDEVLNHLSKYKNLSLLTAVATGLYNTIR